MQSELFKQVLDDLKSSSNSASSSIQQIQSDISRLLQVIIDHVDKTTLQSSNEIQAREDFPDQINSEENQNDNSIDSIESQIPDDIDSLMNLN